MMKSKHTTALLMGNIVLAVLLIWKHFDAEANLLELGLGAMRGDEIHLRIHAKSLAALEAGDPELDAETIDILRKITDAGAQNIEARDRAGLKR